MYAFLFFYILPFLIIFVCTIKKQNTRYWYFNLGLNTGTKY